MGISATWLTIGILALVMVMLVSGRVRIDLVGLIALTLVGVLHLVPLKSLFLGFSSYAAIILAEMFVLGDALRRAGVTNYIASIFESVGRRGEKSLITALMVIPPVPSTFISDVGLMSIFLPTMVRIRKNLNISLHRILMPLAVAIALGGLLSMIGSAGNIIGNTTLAASRLPVIPLFAITPLGVVLVIAGSLFMRFWGIRHLPSPEPSGEFLTDYAEVKQYVSELQVSASSPLIGKTVQDIGYFHVHDVSVLRIFRPNGTAVLSASDHPLTGGDRILIEGDMEAIASLTSEDGLEALADEVRLRVAGIRVVEAMVPQSSVLVHRTLRESRFRTRYGPTVLAILRRGVTQLAMIRDMPLQAGDVLLVMGDRDAIARLETSDDLLVFTDLDPTERQSHRDAAIAAGVVLGVLAVAAVNFLAIQVAALAGIGILVVTGVLRLDQAYRAIDWRIIVLVGGLTPLSLALTSSGVTADVARTLIHAVGAAGPYAVLAIFFWIAALLTQVISNVAAALVLSPLAISVAAGNHWSPNPLIISMVVALSAAPITPLANKVFIMAIRPGNYKYQDFVRIGLPLTFVMFALTLVLAPLLFPFRA